MLYSLLSFASYQEPRGLGEPVDPDQKEHIARGKLIEDNRSKPYKVSTSSCTWLQIQSIVVFFPKLHRPST